ncbi:uncharacterized protein LOC124913898 [Impatiens glandulifera]|uniref:uncharacterized protein LOC124913898 n=1 Tax=Impatiens glandulifera TaxID=253017 RepID=UPI001FB0979C|nr:uncharacterized protein LOC124913898 [Impatiens glandulifera]
MMDNCDKSVTSLAITEKRPNRPGGCIGIFFQLFDWNRRFAKKKLFSRKLLPPVRPKHAPKKFAGDEKFPKLRMIAGENGDDFPNLRKNIDNQSRPMQSPSLVARLMGLESIPAAEKEKSPNVLLSDIDKEKLSLEKISSRNELRPQKIQKTEVYEREHVGRLGFESMPLKNMLSRSRRQRPKLVSPVKSPRMAPGRNNSRLIDVAARILEPGLQSRNRAKGALTYTSSRIHNLPPSMEGNAYSPRSASIDDLMMEGRQQGLNVREVPDHDGVAVKPMKVHSCKNCGDKFDDFASSSSLLKHPSVYASPISQYVEPSTVILEKEKKPVEQRNRQEMGNVFVQTHNEADQSHWPFSSQPSSRQSDIQSSTAFKQKTIRQNKIPMGRDKVHQSSKLSNLQSSRVYDVNVDNKSPSIRSRSRMPVKLDSDALDTGRKTYAKPDDSTSPVRKKRSVNSTIVKQRTGKCETASSKETRQSSFSSTSQNTTRRRLVNSEESSRTNSNKEKNIVSYSYNSPLKHKPGAHKDREYKRMHLNGSVDGNPSSSTIGESSSREEDSCQLSGDALGALLEQKLKELTSQMDDELEGAGGTPKRSTAMILQELITALNAETPTQNVLVDGSDQKKVSLGARVATKFSFKVEERAKGASTRYSHDLDHYSPGSVLETSFSNESCLSSSLDDGSVPGHDHLPPLEAEVDLVDSGYSFLSKGSGRLDRISDILGHISEALCCINIRDSGLKENKSDRAKEVILNAEMVFQSFDGSKEFSLAGYLIEELESLASAMPAMEDIKDGYQLKGFLFDCIVEYLDSRYGPCWKTGFRAWRRTSPTRITGDILTSGVVEEVKRWTKFAGWNVDEIIEWEMSHGLGKWTDFEIEGFEIGVEIEEELLDNLVNEVLADFIM